MSTPADPVAQLLAGIRAQAQMWASAHAAARAGWRHVSFPALLLEHGRLFIPAPRPAHLIPDAPGSCFAAATRLAETHETLIYVEGMALTGSEPLGFDHAWCVDADGRVVDSTLPDGYGRAYVGVPLTDAYRRSQQAARATDAVLTVDRVGWSDNAAVLQHGLPAAAICDLGQRLPRPAGETDVCR
ncbi:hypothetical protein [Planomonospora parontospora]|uniref:hypothetical protein n=1 Tax=Planomonospora parontospora TaxID=58119 RepID=UPI0016713F00|nr:hypothetical protein [Planomonospora parontospora]GGL55306.1 hypothetical protein GCM10014719_65730 [Planomonospora parontospora subsp. antibiotica]GII19799.1 hypothetical protein Ppa05_65250 [Planomonospora parontospora subsp. antibiotica]